MGGSILGGGLNSFLNVLKFPLPLDSFYYDLNHSEKYLDNYADECNKLCRENKSFKNIRLCKILLRFLKDNIRTSYKIESAYNDCILFNYWIYGELEKKYKKHFKTKLVPIYAELQRMWYSLIEQSSNESYYENCKPDNRLIYQDDWTKRRDLYDYCVNYELLKPQFEPYKQYCKHHYTYIKSKAPLYDYFKERCKPEAKYNCPDFYSRCKDYDPSIVLPELSCYDVMKKEEDTAAENALSLEPQPELTADGTSSPDASKLKGEGNHTVTKTGNILLGVVATSMTSGALYKFTPLGGMIRNGLGWNNNNMRNFNGGDIRLYDYSAEPFNPYPGEEHYIGYHPA
ncbi:PIR protein [Plasmodium vivax]|uniref:VIR protein n=1 Tax=Plasmodium vivax TaxID=5855 RepID=A0A565A709_PLAVI|nr:PIR protein [Plasmodium vivax]